MADPIADNADFAVDELKRKARRRLVGAVVLALAAATVLPLLLEQEQKPLGDDVAVQIPPVDSGKFVNRLTPDKAKDAAAEGKADSGTIRPAGKAEPSSTPPAVVAKPDVKAEAKADSKSAQKVEGGAAAPATTAEPKADAGSAAAPGAVAAASPDPKLAPATAAPAAIDPEKVEGFVVQLGAFTDNYGANALANKLKKIGYPAYMESVETSRGKLWRVRVGGYPSRQAAAEARTKLKADGQNGIVVAVK